jgi:hypothetical protein
MRTDGLSNIACDARLEAVLCHRVARGANGRSAGSGSASLASAGRGRAQAGLLGAPDDTLSSASLRSAAACSLSAVAAPDAPCDTATAAKPRQAHTCRGTLSDAPCRHPQPPPPPPRSAPCALWCPARRGVRRTRVSTPRTAPSARGRERTAAVCTCLAAGARLAVVHLEASLLLHLDSVRGRAGRRAAARRLALGVAAARLSLRHTYTCMHVVSTCACTATVRELCLRAFKSSMLKFQLLTPRTYLLSAPRQNAAHHAHARHCCYVLRLRLDVVLASRAAPRNLALPQQLHPLAERRNALQQMLHQKLLQRQPRETQRATQATRGSQLSTGGARQWVGACRLLRLALHEAVCQQVCCSRALLRVFLQCDTVASAMRADTAVRWLLRACRQSATRSLK